MKKTLVTIGIIVFVIGVALFGTAYLVMAEGNNVINACVAKDGSVRIVALEGQCKNKETPLSWNRQGEPGAAGVLGFYTVTSEVDVPGNSLNFATTARCDFGDVVTGGGYRYLDDEGYQIAFDGSSSIANHPKESQDGLGEGWQVSVWNNSGIEVVLEVSAICADLTP
ncbi:MAG: hypothetical protein WBL25_21185 [Anaerolineales bacterium]